MTKGRVWGELAVLLNMTRHLNTELYSLVGKRWIFSNVGSRNQPFTELPSHCDGRIVSQPLKTPTFGKPPQEHKNPKWGEPLDVLLDCDHIVKIPHQDVLDGLPVPACLACRGIKDRRRNAKDAAQKQRAARKIEAWKQNYREIVQAALIEEHNAQERARRERRNAALQRRDNRGPGTHD